MTELSLFKSLDTCASVTDMPPTLLSPAQLNVNLSNITILLSFTESY